VTVVSSLYSPVPHPCTSSASPCPGSSIPVRVWTCCCSSATVTGWCLQQSTQQDRIERYDAHRQHKSGSRRVTGRRSAGWERGGRPVQREGEDAHKCVPFQQPITQLRLTLASPQTPTTTVFLLFSLSLFTPSPLPLPFYRHCLPLSTSSDASTAPPSTIATSERPSFGWRAFSSPSLFRPLLHHRRRFLNKPALPLCPLQLDSRG
jgi:hypothetical protein